MQDQRDGRDGRDGGDRGPKDGGQSGQRGGPQGTEFLELELSRMLLSRAADVAKEAAIDLLREAVRERLRERIGDKLAAIGHLAADELAEDVAANLEIEARIAARMDRAANVGGRLRAVMAETHKPFADLPRAPAKKSAGRGRRRKST